MSDTDTPHKRGFDDRAELVPISNGGVTPENLKQQLDYAQAMGRAGPAIAPALRDNTGLCLAVLDQALRWGLAPYWVAKHAYVVNDRLNYEAQVASAVIHKFAKLKQRLKITYAGDGPGAPNRTCTVTGHFIGEVDPVAYTTPLFKDISPKNSPLWKTDPDQQQAYLAITRWSKRYASDVMGDLPDPDAEPTHQGFDNARDITPLRQRLQGREGREGFAGTESVAKNIDAALAAARDPIVSHPAPSTEPVVVEAPTSTTSSPPAGAETPEAAASTNSDVPSAPTVHTSEAPSLSSEQVAGPTTHPDLIDAAYERGQQDRRMGAKRSATPVEYRDKHRTAEAMAWVKGWNGQ